MAVAAFVDAEGVWAAWINLQDDLVGAGQPLALGATLKHLRSPSKGCYALISRVGGGDDPGEAPIDLARISASIYGSTQAAAALAAVAYANKLRSLDGTPQTVVAKRDGEPLLGPGVILAVDSITGPLNSPDREEARYLVDAVICFTPVP